MTLLFANQRETNLSSTVALIEQALTRLGHDPAATRIAPSGAPPAWQLVVGSATTRVAVIHRTAFPHLRVTARVMTLDDRVDRPALHSHLLELNATLCGAAFATDGDHILVVCERSTLDLDLSEVLEAIERVATCADQHDDVLVARFCGRPGAT